LNKGVFTKAVKVPSLGFAMLPGVSMAYLGDKVVIEPLDVDNYDTWCVRMKLFIMHKKMWNVVVDSSATAEQSQGALALIGLHVKDHHFGKVAAAAFAILAGLPDDYGTLVTISEATSEKMSEKEMLPLLLRTEARLKL
jgi:hypothetical protein